MDVQLRSDGVWSVLFSFSLIFILIRETANGDEFMRKQELIDAAEASGLSRAPIAYVDYWCCIFVHSRLSSRHIHDAIFFGYLFIDQRREKESLGLEVLEESGIVDGAA